MQNGHAGGILETGSDEIIIRTNPDDIRIGVVSGEDGISISAIALIPPAMRVTLGKNQ
jgi:hypothetical protein